VTDAADGVGGDSSITYAEIHSELEEVRRILVDLTGTVERLSSIVASVSLQDGAPVPATSTPTPEAPPSTPSASPPSPTGVQAAPAPEIPASTSPVAPNPVDAILGDTFGRPT
jgi:hypothetical protein